METIISLQNVSKKFVLNAKQRKLEKTNEKFKVAVNGLNLNAYKGQIYGLLGPNGAGKTTTLRMLSTLIKSDSGTLMVDGIDVTKEPNKIREKIGFLTSDLKLEDFFTPNYLFDYYAELHNVSIAERDKQKAKLFTKFGIDKFCEVKIGELSTGMKQKASLAVSLVHNPDIIIFDEPTNGLDVLTSKVVTDFLNELKEEGKTIIVSTHIFSLIEKICDRCGVIINGKMIVEDSLEAVCNGKSLEDAFFDIYKETVGE